MDSRVDKARHPHTFCCQNNTRSLAHSLTHTNTQRSNLQMTSILCLKILVCCTRCLVTRSRHTEALSVRTYQQLFFRSINWKLKENVNVLYRKQEGYFFLVPSIQGHFLCNILFVVTMSLKETEDKEQT